MLNAILYVAPLVYLPVVHPGFRPGTCNWRTIDGCMKPLVEVPVGVLDRVPFVGAVHHQRNGSVRLKLEDRDAGQHPSGKRACA